MRKFKDAEGTEWCLSVNVKTAILLKAQSDFDVKDVLEDTKVILRLGNDPAYLGGILWTLVAKEAESRNLDEMGFFERLNGDSVDSAIETLLAECFDFFPPQKRSALKRSLQRIRDTENRAIEQAMAQLDRVMDKLDEKIATGSELPTNLQELLESTPASSP